MCWNRQKKKNIVIALPPAKKRGRAEIALLIVILMTIATLFIIDNWEMLSWELLLGTEIFQCFAEFIFAFISAVGAIVIGNRYPTPNIPPITPPSSVSKLIKRERIATHIGFGYIVFALITYVLSKVVVVCGLIKTTIIVALLGGVAMCTWLYVIKFKIDDVIWRWAYTKP